MKHYSKKEQMETMRRRFIERRCPSPFHYCNGEVIPIDGRLEMDGHTKELRNRSPCEYYNIERGCTYVRHPKFSLEWRTLRG